VSKGFGSPAVLDWESAVAGREARMKQESGRRGEKEGNLTGNSSLAKEDQRGE
jgi:hypothetical protein